MNIEEELSKYHMTGSPLNDGHSIRFTGKTNDKGQWMVEDYFCECEICEQQRNNNNNHTKKSNREYTTQEKDNRET